MLAESVRHFTIRSREGEFIIVLVYNCTPYFNLVLASRLRHTMSHLYHFVDLHRLFSSMLCRVYSLGKTTNKNNNNNNTIYILFAR